jgi:hypothetical protein
LLFCLFPLISTQFPREAAWPEQRRENLDKAALQQAAATITRALENCLPPEFTVGRTFGPQPLRPRQIVLERVMTINKQPTKKAATKTPVAAKKATGSSAKKIAPAIVATRAFSRSVAIS